MRRSLAACAVCLATLSACSQPALERLTVAAAANLTGAFETIGKSFTAQSGIPVVFSYGPTAALAQQVENGAPLDVLAAADAEHVDSLAASGHIVPETKSLYATGRLALWAPKEGITRLEDLAAPRIKFVAIAQPELAPYGRAAVESLHASGLWDAVQPKLVYGNSISQAKQLAATGNADAALTAYSLVFREPGSLVPIEEKLHAPIRQEIGVVANSPHSGAARKFVQFVLGPTGRQVLIENGYMVPDVTQR